MSAFAGLVASLQLVASCARQAAEFAPRSDVYRAEQVAAERAFERILSQSQRLVAGQPKHRKAVRTVVAAVARAAECLEAIRRFSSDEEIVWRADAVQRAAGRLAELRSDLGRQRTQSLDEVVVAERAWPALPDVFNALRTGQSRESVEHESIDQAAAVASLSTGDEHTSVAK